MSLTMLCLSAGRMTTSYGSLQLGNGTMAHVDAEAIAPCPNLNLRPTAIPNTGVATLVVAISFCSVDDVLDVKHSTDANLCRSGVIDVCIISFGDGKYSLRLALLSPQSSNESITRCVVQLSSCIAAKAWAGREEQS
ncbi:hypothetical protein F4604DRAFT_1928753 [Suillus subluteus]|nr:hypothetical protein F4604DRAFT_1933992 [Suillus subluteus]KAG1864319.1 hypothetical protein F4604DRAFT_1928753 [Suillus subluteus]